MAHSCPATSGRFRWLLPALALGAAVLLGGCVAYPDGYYGYDYGYGYGPGPYYGYGYAPGPSVGIGFGGDGDGWGDHDWRGGGWRGGDDDWHH